MVKASEAALCVAAAAGCWVAAPSTAFLAGQPAPVSLQVPSQHASASAPEQQSGGSIGLPLAAAGILGAVAAATERRSRTCARAESQAVTTWKERKAATDDLDWILPDDVTAPNAPLAFEPARVENFAGGLVGSEYAGFGTYEWDPLDLSRKFPEHLPWYREAELKHGRIAMLAILGIAAPDYVRFPMSDFQDSNFDWVEAHNQFIYGLGTGPMWWLLTFCAIVESLRFREMGFGFEKLTLENAGDLNFGKQFFPQTKEGQLQMRIKELKNGRLAMIAFGGIATQAVLYGHHQFPFV